MDVRRFATLDELSVGVVTIFRPTDTQLLGHYLYNKIKGGSSSTHKTFPEINIYGKDGIPPWEIWRVYQEYKYPHQDFIYFFARAAKINPGKVRNSRKIGTGTWHETETVKPICFDGSGVAYGSLRKFKYLKKESQNAKGKKKEVDVVAEENNGAWLMDEYTINQAPGWALYRLKVNVGRGDKNKRKYSEEDEGLMRSKQPLKKQKVEPTRAPLNRREQQQDSTSEEMLSFNEDDRVAQTTQILMSDDDDDDETIHLSPSAISLNEAELRACLAQEIPNEQQPQPEQYSEQLGAESSSSQEQQLLADDYDISNTDFDSFDVESCMQSINEYFKEGIVPCWDLDGD